MTAITYRKPALPLDILVRSANGIFLRVPLDALRGRRVAAPQENRRTRKLLREGIALSQAKKK